MSSEHHQQAAKPGTACYGCRGRKLKCSREIEGCSNCLKTGLPCVYPAPDTAPRRKRGPYKKDKPARERHLEDLVKYLEPKTHGSTTKNDLSGGTQTARVPATDSVGLQRLAEMPTSDATAGATVSEDLVKDALIALTKAHVSETAAATYDEYASRSAPEEAPPQSKYASLGICPPARRILEYWHIFVTRVNPMLSLIHCQSFGQTLISAMDDVRTVRPAVQTLLFSIYNAAVSSCTAKECRRRFGEDRSQLLQHYGRVIESALADNYSMPELESLQALVLYIARISIRRDDSLANVRALFSLAVRMAQLTNLQKDPSTIYPPLEAELRRRLWWHLCGLESRGAEESGARSRSIIESADVQLPANLNDSDLDCDTKELPHPREGPTDVTWLLCRMELAQLIRALVGIKVMYRLQKPDADPEIMKAEQRNVLEAGRQNFQSKYLRHLHPSRPLDWLCIVWTEGMLIKARLLVDYPFGQVPTKEMPPKERLDLLQASVDIIRLTNAVSTHKAAAERWAWYFRGWAQWHSIGIVVTELGYSHNQQFIDSAWSALGPTLELWDKVYPGKRDEPAWDHVHTLIERARHRRDQQPRQLQEPEVTTISTSQGRAVEPAAPYSSALINAGAFAENNIALPPMSSTTNTNNVGAQSRPTISCSDMSFLAGPPQATSGMDYDFSYVDGLADIDFSAFEGVFGDSAWDFSSPEDLGFDNIMTEDQF